MGFNTVRIHWITKTKLLTVRWHIQRGYTRRLGVSNPIWDVVRVPQDFIVVL